MDKIRIGTEYLCRLKVLHDNESRDLSGLDIKVFYEKNEERINVPFKTEQDSLLFCANDLLNLPDKGTLFVMENEGKVGLTINEMNIADIKSLIFKYLFDVLFPV